MNFLAVLLFALLVSSCCWAAPHRFHKLGFGEEFWQHEYRHGVERGRRLGAGVGRHQPHGRRNMDEDHEPVAYFSGPMGDTPESADIVSAGMRKDVDGNDVHAHGGGIYSENGTYYWFGTTQKVLSGDLSDGINVYKSSDMQHWQFGAKVFENTSITVPLAPGMSYRIERPKVIYNKVTKTYVMYFHLDDSRFSLKMVGVATSKTVMGQYAFVAGWKPDGEDSYDMGLFYDDHTDDAYLVRSVQNQYAGISKLTDDFMNTTGITSKGPRMEGQAIFRRNNKYYLIGSHLTGWSANPAILCVADKNDTLVGATWTDLGNPTGSHNTFNSQSTFVFSYIHPSGKEMNMFMADRWKAPDVIHADYLWLPFVDQGHTLNITFEGEWKIKDY